MSRSAVAFHPDQLKEFISGMDQIPTLPEVAARLLKMIEDPDVSLGQISKVMTNDPALSAKVLKLVNSAFFGLKQPVASLRDAIVLLGLKNVRDICMGVSVIGVFRARDPVSKESMERVWKHSVATGFAGKTLGKRIGLAQPEEAFTAGLLHDIGRMLLLSCASEETINAGQIAEEDHLSILETEMLALGFDHRHVGGWIAYHWKLPPQIISSIIWHHQPTEKTWKNQEHAKLAVTVGLASEMANFKGLYFCRAAPDIDLSSAMRSLNLDEMEILELMDGLDEEVESFYNTIHSS